MGKVLVKNKKEIFILKMAARRLFTMSRFFLLLHRFCSAAILNLKEKKRGRETFINAHSIRGFKLVGFRAN